MYSLGTIMFYVSKIKLLIIFPPVTTMLITKIYDDDHLGFAISIKTNGHFAKNHPRIIHILSNFEPLSSFFNNRSLRISQLNDIFGSGAMLDIGQALKKKNLMRSPKGASMQISFPFQVKVVSEMLTYEARCSLCRYRRDELK